MATATERALAEKVDRLDKTIIEIKTDLRWIKIIGLGIFLEMGFIIFQLTS